MFRSTWPRVVRSPEVADGQAFVMGGECFEDGLRRVLVGYGITPDMVTELTAAIEDGERLTRMLDAMNRLNPDRTIAVPRESATGCFGHCDPEGWAECRRPADRTIRHEETD